MKYMLIVLLGACSYGVLSTFVKICYGLGYTVNQVVGSQVFLGLLLLAAARLFIRKTGKLSLKQAVQLILAGMTPGLTGIFYYSSLQTIPASLAIVLLFQFTWLGLLLESLILRRRPDKLRIYALIPLLAGTLLAADIGGQGLHELTGVGVLFGLLAALSYTIFIIASGKTATGVHPIYRSTIMMLGSVAATFIIFPPTFLIDGTLLHGLLPWALLLALFGMVIPTICFAVGAPKIGGGPAAIIGAAELPAAVLMSTLFLREPVHWMQWLGVIAILAGIALPEVWQRRRMKHAAKQ